MVELLDRRILKERAAGILETAQVSPKSMTALYLGLTAVLEIISGSGTGWNLFAIFLSVLTALLSLVLDAGFVVYCMTIRRGERAEYLTLFDGFGMVGKLILLALVKTLFIFFWSLLFVIPGIIASYRYRFALYNLMEDPDLDFMEALGMSKRQTMGYKSQLFMLDLSYLGWALLASLPYMVYQEVIASRTQAAMMAVGDVMDVFTVASTVPMDVFGIPALVWTILIPLWALVVSLFYRPNYQCVELDYFAAAKRSSGLGVQESGGDNGFDGFFPGGPDDGGYQNGPYGGSF